MIRYGDQTKMFPACMNSQHISDRSATAGPEFGFKLNGYHCFVMVNTAGQRDVTSNNVGEHVNRVHERLDNTHVQWWVRAN